MRNLLDLIYEYRELMESQDLRLKTVNDRARLFGLGQLVGEQAPWSSEGPESARRLEGHPVHFTLGGGFGRGEIRRITGGGAVIASPEPPRKGVRLLVRLHGRDSDETYVFPARVCWRRKGRPGLFGVEFDGSPERSVETPTSVLWASPVRFGGRRLRPLTS